MATQMNYFFYFITFITALFIGCEEEIVENDQGRFMRYGIEAVNNADLLSKDIVGTIEGQKIILKVPDNLDVSNLVASFSYEGKAVVVGTTPQVSGQTANDFSNTVVYTIIAPNDARIDYTIEIQRMGTAESVFTSFGFLKENNSVLLRDYNATISDDTIKVSLPSTAKNLIAVFETNATEVTVNGTPQVSAVTANDFSKPIVYKLVSASGLIKNYIVKITWTSSIPHLVINTDNAAPVVSKDDYVYADLAVTANGWGEDYTGRTRIRGRGNSTWSHPKKPYRMKLDNDVALLSLAAEKDWVLLANYIDPTLMLNAVAFKMGQLIDLKYTNHAVPVDVTLNGVYLGNYTLTEQVEVSKSRVNIDKNNGVLLEFDTNFDEDFQFKSNYYGLPVMVKDPDVESDAQFQKIKDDFQQLENAITSDAFPNSGYKNYIDIESLVKYLIVHDLAHNMEIMHPKSTYMHKDATGKYYMGPIWDFDWAYGFEGPMVHFARYTDPLYRQLTDNSAGYALFTRILQDPEVIALYKQTWAKFQAEKLPLLLEYVDFYATSIAESQKKDAALWPIHAAKDYPAKINEFKTWLQNRAKYISEYIQDY